MGKFIEPSVPYCINTCCAEYPSEGSQHQERAAVVLNKVSDLFSLNLRVYA